MTDKNEPPSTSSHRLRDDALQLGPRKKVFVPLLMCPYHNLEPPLHSCHTDPLVSRGHHFGRTVHALCNVYTILMNGLLRLGELAEEPDEAFTLE